MLLVQELCLCHGDLNCCVEILRCPDPVVEDLELLLVGLLLVPLVALLLQLLPQKSIVEVIVLSCFLCLLLFLFPQPLELALLILFIEGSVLVGEDPASVLTDEEADLGQASQRVSDSEVELVDDCLRLCNLDCSGVRLLALVQVRPELCLHLLAEVWQLEHEMTKGNRSVWDVAGEGLFVLWIRGVLGLELKDLIVEDLAVHMPEQERLVELQLRAQVKSPSSKLVSDEQDGLGIFMLFLNHHQILRVPEIKSD